MNQVAKRLSELPDIKELSAFIASKMSELNSLDNLPDSNLSGLTDPVAYTTECKARQRAHDVLSRILEPLLPTAILTPGTNKIDYVA